MFCKNTTRGNILDAAKQRFLHYGYAKTTMAEIAADCKMSAGNLYRYFPSKLDIAEAIAQSSIDQIGVLLREILKKAGLTAKQRLREFFYLTMRVTYDMLENDKRIFEMAQVIAAERPEFANQQLARERALMAEILAAGNANGEFEIRDVIFTAEMIQSATMKFRYPQLFSRLTFEKLERELDGVLALILNGLDDGGAVVTTQAAPAALQQQETLVTI
ncbi:MAG TPA: TetR/AcrR family transcriptional regulator [Alphaproteobacteria bacterium]|nr:TetR/AcrR family transcriptional regulator [Alphaproteobacteria bacterium]HAJ47606.1 TetR/AcrR family transcriptional regulator [Alphaproteobacteria bacterium]